MKLKADTFSANSANNNANNAAYTSGSIKADVSTCTSYGNGVNGQNASGFSSGCSAISVSTLSLGSAQGTFAISGATNKTVSPNTNGIELGSFVFQAGQSEDISVTQVNLNFAGTANLNDLKNITLKNGSTTIGNIYPLAASSLSFSTNGLVIPRNQSITLSVIADAANIASGSTTALTANAQYRGNTSQVTAYYPVSGNTNAITSTFNVASFANPSLSSASPATSTIIGGISTEVAKYSILTTQGTARVSELYFTVTQSGNIVNSLEINGISYPVVSNKVSVTGLSIPVTNSETLLSVKATPACYGSGACNTSLFANNGFTVTLNKIVSDQPSLVVAKGTSIANNDASDTSLSTSNTFYAFNSFPTRVWASANGTSIVASANNGNTKIGSITVTANNSGSISVKSLPINISGVSGAISDLTINNVTTGIAVYGGSGIFTNNSKVSLNALQTVTAGQSVVFDVFASIAAVAGSQSNNTPSLSLTRIGASANASSFEWVDTFGSNTTPSTGSILSNFGN